MHQHCHHSHDYGRAFAIGVTLNLIYVCAEAAFGLLVNSLSLLADAGHNLSDVFGLLLAWAAYRLAKVKPSERFTYGLGSSTILASLFNAMILLVVVGGISWEAIRRFAYPVEVEGFTTIWVASIGVVINTVTAFLFFKGHHHDLNIKGAFLHMAADAAISLGVVVAGVLILFTGSNWIDPTVSLLIAVAIFLGTWGLFRDSIRLAIHGVPAGLEVRKVEEYLQSVAGVEHVHDLHIWAISTTDTALTAHLVKPEIENEDGMIAEIIEKLRVDFGIAHATIQIERNSRDAQCQQVSPDSI